MEVLKVKKIDQDHKTCVLVENACHSGFHLHYGVHLKVKRQNSTQENLQVKADMDIRVDCEIQPALLSARTMREEQS